MDILRETLERFYREYDFQERLRNDPVRFLHRYEDPRDIEVVGFIASCLSYGRIALFSPVVERILQGLGRHPYLAVLNFDPKADGKYLKGVYYRFNRQEDIVCLIYILGQVLRQWRSIEHAFSHCCQVAHGDKAGAIDRLSGLLLAIDTSAVYGKDIKPYGLTQFFPSPKRGSACKRMNLFLRWMVRQRDVDLGLWRVITPAELLIPLDTHIARISRCIGLTRRTVADWDTVLEITSALRALDPEDPLKYDFALCHHGVSRNCRGQRCRNICKGCAFIHLSHTL